MSTQPDIEGFRHQIAATIHAHWKLFLAQGILLMVLGLLAVAMPNIATLAVEIFVGWLFLIAGILRAVSVWHARQMPRFWMVDARRPVGGAARLDIDRPAASRGADPDDGAGRIFHPRR